MNRTKNCNINAFAEVHSLYFLPALATIGDHTKDCGQICHLNLKSAILICFFGIHKVKNGAL